MKARKRLLQLVVRLLGNPYTYTKSQLEAYFEVTSKNGLDDDFKILRDLELLHHRRQGNRYVYAILPDASFPELKQLQPLSAADKARLDAALKYLPEREQQLLRAKLDRLYDFSKLGLQALRKPHLEKIDRLEQAKRLQCVAILHNYHSSNSNTVVDRRVEPYYVDVNLDTLQSYEVNSTDRTHKHFRISRIDRVTVTDEPWQFQSEHYVQQTDPFRIVNDEQVSVHLTLSTRARNEIREKFPMSQQFIVISADGEAYDFQCMVNVDFFGLLPFVLANHDQVIVHEPEELRDRVREAASKILKKFS